MRTFTFALAATSLCLTSQAAPPQPVADPVDFFQAREAGDLDAKFIAANEKRGHLLLKNNLQKPLTIRMPAAFAGVPVLAQFQPFQPLPIDNANTPQGVAFPGANVFGPNNNQRFQNGLLNVPPERLLQLESGQKRTIRIKSVCLDHGKPTPNARMKYDVVPLADYNSNAELAALISVFGEGKYSQQAAQVMAWHYANGKTIDELRNLRSKKSKQPIFTKAQIDEATRLQSVVETRLNQQQENVPPTVQTTVSDASGSH